MFWFDGHLSQDTTLPLAITDPAFLYGATVFTTLRVYQHSLDHPLTRWADHRHRLSQTLAVFQWPEPNWEQVRQGAECIQATDPIVRITCFPDGREFITGRPLPPDLASRQRQGITAWLATGELYRRSLPGFKTGNYLASWLALHQAQRQGATEAILADESGRWLETSTGNLWGWADGQWWTPPLGDGLLPGVARIHLLEHLRCQGVPVGEAAWEPAVVRQFEALAYSNSGVQIVPIHTVRRDRSTLSFDPYHRSLDILRAAFAEAKT